MNNIKLAAIAHSKHRDIFGLVGIEVSPELKKVYVKLARQWPRNMINEIASEIGTLYRKIQWGDTFIDQQTGQHFIQDLKRIEKLRLNVITTQKNLKDPDEIENIRVIDKIEMTQFMLTLRQNHQVEFPPNPSKTMKDLEEQMALYSEHKTEAGNIDYFAPGSEKDNLTKGLLISCFAARKYLKVGDVGVYVGGQMPDAPPVNYAMGTSFQPF